MIPIVVGIALGVVIAPLLFGTWALVLQVRGTWASSWPANWKTKTKASLVPGFGILVSVLGLVLLPIYVVVRHLNEAVLPRLPGFGELESLFYGTHIVSGALGYLFGIVVVRWYIDARSLEARNVGKTGIAIAMFGLLIVVMGLNRDLDFTGRLNKLSTTLLSFELGKKSETGLSAPVPTQPSNSGPPTWAATQRIATSWFVLEDLVSKALNRDKNMITFVVAKEGESQVASAPFPVIEELKGLIPLRKSLHRIKRDARPTFFDGERLELTKLAIALRELILTDLRGDDSAKRGSLKKYVASAFAEFTLKSRHTVCLLGIDIESSKARCGELATSERDRELELAAEINRIGNTIPDRQVNRETPYFSIIAATMLYASGESEAAASLLSQWLGIQKIAQTSGTVQLEEVRSALFAVRVFTVMGYFLVDPTNPVHSELAARYFFRALEESDKIIDSNAKVRTYFGRMRYAHADKVDSVIANGVADHDDRNTCPPSDVPGEVAYFLYRRVALLNNVIMLVSAQDHLLLEDKYKDRFSKHLDDLRGIKLHCLIRAAGDPEKPISNPEVSQRIAYFLDTIARGLERRAIIYRTDDNSARRFLCGAYNASFHATRMLEPSGVDKGDWLYDAELVTRPFASTGEAIYGRQAWLASRSKTQELRLQIERLGEGACDVPTGVGKSSIPSLRD